MLIRVAVRAPHCHVFASRALARLGTIYLTPTQERPDDARIFIGHRHCGPIPTSPLKQAPHPLAPAIRFRLGPAERGPGSMDQEGAQVPITPFTNAQQAGLPPGGILVGHQPQPGRKLTAIFKHTDITDGRKQRRRCQQPNARNRQQTLGLGMRLRDCVELGVIAGDFAIHGLYLFLQRAEQFGTQRRELRLTY